MRPYPHEECIDLVEPKGGPPSFVCCRAKHHGGDHRPWPTADERASGFVTRQEWIEREQERSRLAELALPAVIANVSVPAGTDPGTTATEMAKFSHMIADAMLKARDE